MQNGDYVSANGISEPESAYLKRHAIESVSQLCQSGKELSLRPIGHTQARRPRLLNEILRYQSAQLLEVEYGDVFEVILDDFKLRRRGFGEHVRLGGHLVESLMMVLASGQLNPCPFIYHQKAHVLGTAHTVRQRMTSIRNFSAALSLGKRGCLLG